MQVLLVSIWKTQIEMYLWEQRSQNHLREIQGWYWHINTFCIILYNFTVVVVRKVKQAVRHNETK